MYVSHFCNLSNLFKKMKVFISTVIALGLAVCRSCAFSFSCHCFLSSFAKATCGALAQQSTLPLRSAVEDELKKEALWALFGCPENTRELSSNFSKRLALAPVVQKLHENSCQASLNASGCNVWGDYWVTALLLELLQHEEFGADVIDDASEVQSKMMFMGHQILSCHVLVVRPFFILWKMLLSS